MERKFPKKSLRLTSRHSVASKAKDHGGWKAMFTANSLANHLGTTVRTIQYYDRIGLFPPTDRTDNGYRLYDEAAVERLREILFYRQLDFSLNDVKKLVSASPEEWNGLLDAQMEKLREEKTECEEKLETIRELRQKGPESVTEYFRKELTEETKQCIVNFAEQK